MKETPFVYNDSLFIIVFLSYIEWSFHEPYSEVYDFEGQADFEHFLTILKEENMLVIMRPGPYIGAERDLVSIIPI